MRTNSTRSSPVESRSKSEPKKPSPSTGKAVTNVEGEPFRFLVQSDKTDEKYLVDVQESSFTGACNCMHFLVRCAPKIAYGHRGPTVRCKHINRARDFFLEEILPKLAVAMGMDEPDLPHEELVESQRTLYSVRRREYLGIYPRCAVFPALRATQIHHSRGRLGPLLLDQRFWIPVSMAGHQWIDSHREEARKREWMGIPLLCARGNWNALPPEKKED